MRMCDMSDLWDRVYTYGEVGLSTETINEVLDIIEKQESKKIDIYDYGKAHCPICKTDIHGIGKIKFCFICGQKLEW
jgi:hypothetical protein